MLDAAPLREQIITYIGNKRRLLPFIERGIREVMAEEGWQPAAAWCGGNDEQNGPGRISFVDAFAGSGVVSRMARMMGLAVHANDMEAYAAPLIRPFLQLSPSEVDPLFAPVAERIGLPADNAYRRVLDRLNSLDAPLRSESLYFAAHYAPAKSEQADPDRERLFYTRENALKIDALLELLHGPAFEPTGDADSTAGAKGGANLARDVVLASLLYEMSVHVNTSGVMKGYHRGWGGRGKDALLRILAPLELEPLPLIDGPKGSVTTLPAETLFSLPELGEPEIIYADPPYNMHQYGSNYHLLTTAVLNDRYDPGPVVQGSRAGIRRDHNRSAFCRSQRDPRTGLRECEGAFRSFLGSLRGRYLLVSYNTDGIIPPEEMTRLLADGGRNRVSAAVQGHVKFKGGKNTQSARRTREILYRVDLGRGTGREQVDGVLALLSREDRLGRLLDSYVDPQRLPWRAKENGKGAAVYYSEEGAAVAKVRRDYRLAEVYAAGVEEKRLGALEAARIEKPEVMELYIERGLVGEAIKLLRSFKIKKYRGAMEEYAARIREIAGAEDRRRLEALLESYGSETRRARRS